MASIEPHTEVYYAHLNQDATAENTIDTMYCLPKPSLIFLPPSFRRALPTVLISPASQDSEPSASRPLTRKPLLVAFHGSNESIDSWTSFTQHLTSSLPDVPLLLYSRIDHSSSSTVPEPPPSAAIDDLCSLLTQLDLQPPYILVAFSYGGCVARTFLQYRQRDVAGMVLVETGQETALPADMEALQLKNCVLGDKPLSVIRGNSLIEKWRQLEREEQALLEKIDGNAETRGCSEIEMKEIERKRDLLGLWDREDERLKKAQLGLSRRSRYVQASKVGHNVVRYRPDVVVEEVKWVLDNVGDEVIGKGKRWERLKSRIKQIMV